MVLKTEKYDSPRHLQIKENRADFNAEKWRDSPWLFLDAMDCVRDATTEVDKMGPMMSS
jgi:hypothetical protein